MFEHGGEQPITVAFLAERTRAEAAPAGIAGGESGASGELYINGERVDPKAQHFIEPGGTVLIRTPGGGGYGAATERATEHLEADRIDGYAA
jgi:N-methylhydantoinase B